MAAAVVGKKSGAVLVVNSARAAKREQKALVELDWQHWMKQIARRKDLDLEKTLVWVVHGVVPDDLLGDDGDLRFAYWVLGDEVGVRV